MDLNWFEKITNIIEGKNINTLQIEKGDFKLYYNKDNDQITLPTEKFIQQTDNAEVGGSPKEKDVNGINKTDHLTTYQIKSPMTGVFYSNSDKDSEPYVKLGSKVLKGDNVCVLEAMKLLHEIQSEKNGTITNVLAKDGDVIEYGQPLFTIEVGEFDDK